jgi:hypothetical protein
MTKKAAGRAKRHRGSTNAAVRLESITRAAKVIGKKIRLRLVDAA